MLMKSFGYQNSVEGKFTLCKQSYKPNLTNPGYVSLYKQKQNFKKKPVTLDQMLLVPCSHNQIPPCSEIVDWDNEVFTILLQIDK